MATYDSLTFNNGEYIPQYAGAPLKEIQNTADVLSTRHYQNLASASQLEILANQLKSKLLPGARPAVDKHITSIDEALQEMARTGGENSTARINALATAFQGDEALLRANARSAEVQKEMDLEAQIRSQGRQPLRKQGAREALMNASLDSDLYSTPYQSSVEPYEDPTPHMEAIWKPLNPDSVEGMIQAAPGTKLSQLLPEAYKAAMAGGKNGQPDLNLFFQSVTRGGITGGVDKNGHPTGKIGALLDSAWSSYKLTPAYRQQHDLLGRSDDELKNELFQKGLMRVFTNVSREYRPTPAWAGDDGSGKTPAVPTPTYAPAQIVESAIPYNEDGTTKSFPSLSTPGMMMDPAERRGLALAEAVTGQKFPQLHGGTSEPKVKELNPQFVQDKKATDEIWGANTPIGNYVELVKTRTSNAWTVPLTAEQITPIEKEFQRQFSLREYMDPNTGKIIQAFDKNNEMTDEFKELTGGNPENFKVESVYDTKHHFTKNKDAGEVWVKPIAVVATDKDGVTRRFFASQFPGGYNMDPVDVNENVIYTSVNTRPGQYHNIAPGVEARELLGNQWTDALTRYNVPPDKAKMATMPIEATIKDPVTGQTTTMLFDSPRHLALTLGNSGIKLDIKK